MHPNLERSMVLVRAGAMLMEGCLAWVELIRTRTGRSICPREVDNDYECRIDPVVGACPVDELPRVRAGKPLRATVRELGEALCWWEYLAGMYFEGSDLESLRDGIKHEKWLLGSALEGNTAERREETGISEGLYSA